MWSLIYQLDDLHGELPIMQVRELELNMDLKSVNNLLEFLEKVFNGGSGELQC